MDKHLTTPHITVFMAVYNGAKYVRQAINSILNQSYGDFELLIINDGSTDNSVDIIRTFKDPRIRLIENSENKGLVYTRNLGIKSAKGMYLAILDCDDIAMPDRLRLQVDFMTAHPEIAICGGHAISIDSSGIDIHHPINVIVGSKDMSLYMVFGNIFVNSSLMFKRAVMLQSGGYLQYHLAEDYEFSWRIANEHEVANIDYVLVSYRIHEESVSNKKEEMQFYVKQIISTIQVSLNMPHNERLINIHSSLISNNPDQFEATDYLDLLSALKAANIALLKYPVKKFNRLLIQQWFDILFFKKEKRLLGLFFNKRLFEWDSSTAKQIRRVLKRSLKSWR